MRYLNEEELTIASRFLFLSMAMVVIQQDMQHFQKGAFKITEHYMGLLKRMEAEAVNERRVLRSTMLHKQIKVVTLEKNDSFSSYLFLCRGREEKRNYFNPAIRKKVLTILEELMEKGQSDQYASAKT
ncbi:MAG: hypothetical protein ACQEWU_09595 [Bacillota bacterium]|uniref:Uncharacterized protein n=1 Tax=Virgibacillus salarius TaxID=447199 RepID=A0A941DVB6_9BACI|nr:MULTISPECIES: hypothetical protein [Virgibacillus]NAZ10060.1 hypothetical protein [Agaribacter marinus]MBR7797350.1 hypothetical protein [Virgibacillus salarius]MCC2250832.1 hypothetical protein [Virgibacillus sp. AGTR]MDY7046324.1 hypothetical protein [Virgibacillus sp. M23]QRZ16493.1 hypothetical protein JUJ52_11745 [Virgibacillus sp. AGTR]